MLSTLPLDFVADLGLPFAHVDQAFLTNEEEVILPYWTIISNMPKLMAIWRNSAAASQSRSPHDT